MQRMLNAMNSAYISQFDVHLISKYKTYQRYNHQPIVPAKRAHDVQPNKAAHQDSDNRQADHNGRRDENRQASADQRWIAHLHR